MADHQRSLFEVIEDESLPVDTVVAVSNGKEVGRIVGVDLASPRPSTSQTAAVANGKVVGFATDEEVRNEAIAYIKREAHPHLIALAKARVGYAAKDAGVTAEDFRTIAERFPQHVLVGSKNRSWSWVGPHLATLARKHELGAFFVEGIPVKRYAKRDASHGNDHRVYLHPDDPRVTGGARSQLAEP